MTSPRTSLAYARQSRVRVRSSVGLAAICFGAAVIAVLFGATLPWLFGGGAFFLVIAGVELFNARYNERRARERRPE